MFDTEEDMSDLFSDIDKYLKDSQGEPSVLLTDEEVQRLIVALAHFSGEEGFSEDQAVAIVRWAEQIRVDTSILDLVLEGSCDVGFRGQEVVVKITDQGRAENRGLHGDTV